MTTRRTTRTVLAGAMLVLVATLAGYVFAQSEVAENTKALPGADHAALTETVQAYHAALTAQDRDAALALLAPDLMVLESGWIETAEEYLSHHLEADMEFSGATSGEHKVLRTVVEGDVGWVISSSTSKGEFRGHDINSAGAEIMVLGRTDDGWKIRAIHWSSRKLSD